MHRADWELGFPGTKECDWGGSDLGLAHCGCGWHPAPSEVSSLGSWYSKNMLEFLSPFSPGFPHLKVWSEKASFGVWAVPSISGLAGLGKFGKPSSLGTDVHRG